ncbi:MAG: MBL fold metallo-hydrolase [Desulfitobacteriaceae bacterium]|nr:MBL fold metallo-hydrolase [Desulfitobacteriaceae bacterium]MDD4346619.1 MBL fold metallo-hydrolase [Desulfitobacteriaceae bacterium]MDD4401240.1 MBL fold metallo-hydrolase [Desulfitobacteriaceae bacterium]
MLIHEQLGIYKVELPLLHRVKHVNCYAVKGKNGWWLIDAGLSREATYKGWLQFFEERSIKGSDIKGIYLTHYHSDHYGCSGWLQEYSGAPVYIGSIDAKRINYYWKKGDYLLEAIGVLYRSNGMPEEAIRRVIEAEAEIIPLTLPHAELTTLEDGQTVNLGDNAYQVILTPGHSDGHICFYNKEYSLLFSGDHLLPDTSSIIGVSAQPGTLSDPLADFLSSLNSIHSLNCTLVLPAHGRSFANIEKRIKRLGSYHRRHLELTKNSIGSSATAYEVCSQIYSPDISGNELRFVMAEIKAHLVYLVYQGELEAVLEDGIYWYRWRKDRS